MGQGAESCGGYEHDYDPYEETLEDGLWTQKNGDTIHISKMTDSHIRNVIRLCKQESRFANFSCDSEKWDGWIESFEDELFDRLSNNKNISNSNTHAVIKNTLTNRFQSRGEKVGMKCHCGNEYQARSADIKRGWGLSCSKSCAALRRKNKKLKSIKLTK